MNGEPNEYRSAKSDRPGWANALIVAAVLFLAALVFTFSNGLAMPTPLFYLAVLVALVVAAIKALMSLGR